MDSADWLLAIALGVLVCGLLAAPNPMTLADGAYAHALNVVQNQPAGPAETLMRGAYDMLGTSLGNASTDGRLSFFKNLPLFLGALSAMLAYGTLRLLNFDRLESMLAAALVMMAPAVGLAFFPGLVVTEMLAVPLMLLGFLGIAVVAGEKNEKMAGRPDSGFGKASADSSGRRVIGGSGRTASLSSAGGSGMAFFGLLLAIIGFSAAIWIYPWASILLAALLLGSLLEAKEHLHDLGKLDNAARMRLAALVLPLAVLFITPLPVYTLSASSILLVLQKGWMLGGLAFISFVALRRGQRHPQALMYALLTAAGLLMGGVSPAAAALAWLMPAAYGLHVLKDWEGDPLSMRAAMVGLLVVVPLFGLMSGSQDLGQAAGSAMLVAAGVVAMVHLWGWSSEMVRSGAAIFLLAAAMMALAASVSTITSNGLYLYAPLDADTQAALIWIGNSSQLAGSPVAALASPEAVEFLAHGKSAMTSKEMVKWLAASKNGTFSTAGAGPDTAGSAGPVKLAPGTLVVVPTGVFDIMAGRENDIGRNWTLAAFRYIGKTQDSPPLVVFDSNQNLRILYPLDGYGNLVAARTYLFAMPGQNYAKTLTIGDVQMLRQSGNFTDEGNLLIWPNDELNARVLNLFEDKPAGYDIVHETPKVRVLKVTG